MSPDILLPGVDVSLPAGEFSGPARHISGPAGEFPLAILSITLARRQRSWEKPRPEYGIARIPAASFRTKM
jgi:hypothetical protein